MIRSPSSSARVLLTTIFGDALLPREQSIGVQALAELVAPVGISERLVRTSLQRLSTEQLVRARRDGRRSFYAVDERARATFAQAEQRIYHRPRTTWDGRWTIGVLAAASGPEIDATVRELRWLGIGSVGAGVHLSATIDTDVFAEVAKRTGARFAVLTRAPAGQIATIGDGALAGLVTELDDLRVGYRSHLDRFATIDAPADPESAFVERTLLIDSWRRLALRDPDLPAELHADDWPADAAFRATADLYHRLFDRAEEHLDRLLGTSTAPRPERF